MRCMVCERASFSHICSTCQKDLLRPSIHKRKLQNGVDVISFYGYGEIKELLHTKHTDIGYYIYSILAKNSMKIFAREFTNKQELISIAVDDHAKSGYSHTAVLNRALKSKTIKPEYNRLRARNRVSYSGKSREFRVLNPRRFELKGVEGKEVILVDDIITTGSTLEEAVRCMQAHGNKVLFCLTLADASIN